MSKILTMANDFYTLTFCHNLAEDLHCRFCEHLILYFYLVKIKFLCFEEDL